MFKKYNSIENHYRQKYIINSISQHPEIETARYSITEKIDGANIQFFFKKGQEMKVGKRSSFLSLEDSFFDIWSVITKNKDVLDRFQSFTDEADYELRVFGELYGPGINGRVDYGGQKNFLFFDIELDGRMVPQKQFEEIMSMLNIEGMMVPQLGYADGIQEALKAACEFNSHVLENQNNPAEGVVIKPYEKEFIMGNGSRFIIKKKSDKFKEKESGTKTAVKADLPESVVSLMLEFRGYVNRNRLLGIFSKYGEIKEPKQIGEYLQYLIKDAKEDFLKDHELPDTIDSKLQKKIFNVGGHGVNLLKEFL